MRKILSIALVILVAFTVSAPRAAATGVGGAALTVSEMAGVVGLIAGSLGIVFTGAGDMHDACEAFVRGLDPNSAAYLALASAVAQGSTIYIAGSNAVNYLGGLVDSVRSFFVPGYDVAVGDGSVVVNLGGLYHGKLSSGLFTGDLGDATRIPYDDEGSFTVSGSDGVTRYMHTSWDMYNDAYIMIYDKNGENVGRYQARPGYHDPFIVFCMYPNSAYNETLFLPCLFGYRDSDNALYCLISFPGAGPISVTGDFSVSDGSNDLIPVFQEAGALAPDLVGGVWDKLAEDAAAQNGNVTIDTNVGTYQGGATGYVDGDPNGVIAAPQAPSLGGVGSTKTETDTSTGTTTQTQTQTGTQAVPDSTTANPAISDTQAKTEFNGVALTLSEIFPFCIPFDVYFMLKGLAVPREAPSFEIPLQLGSWLNFSHTFEFSQFESYAAAVRSGELAVFVVGLAAATRKFIKW